MPAPIRHGICRVWRTTCLPPPPRSFDSAPKGFAPRYDPATGEWRRIDVQEDLQRESALWPLTASLNGQDLDDKSLTLRLRFRSIGSAKSHLNLNAILGRLVLSESLTYLVNQADHRGEERFCGPSLQ